MKQVAFLKVVTPSALGVKFSAKVTGGYYTREEAEASPEPGKVYPVITGRKVVKDWNAARNS